jgi:subtilisin family serine protease
MRYFYSIFFISILFGCKHTYNYIDENDSVYIDSNISESNISDLNISDNNISDKEIDLNTEPYFYTQWYLECNDTYCQDNDIDYNASINAKDILSQYSGKGVIVAIIDDGLDITHIELNGSIIKTYDIVNNSNIVSHSSHNGYHGTATTGIVAANYNNQGIIGIARDSKIVFLKYHEDMSDSEIIELFRKAEELGADIINCSWGTYDVSPAVKDTIVDLSKNGRDGKGIIIVFAVGNDSRDMGNDESAIPEVIAVGSTDEQNQREWYSNYGENLDIMAPGGYDIGITTLDQMGDNGIATLDDDYLLANDPMSFIGTSASAPIVSGAIALLLEKDSNLTRREVEELLHLRSDKIGRYEYIDGFNKYYGYGKLNLKKLLSD